MLGMFCMLRMKGDLQHMGVGFTAAATVLQLSHFKLCSLDAEYVCRLFVV